MQNINWEMELTFRKSQIIENCLKNHEISIKEIKKTFEETEVENSSFFLFQIRNKS